jgi:hypothetical protein
MAPLTVILLKLDGLWAKQLGPEHADQTEYQ